MSATIDERIVEMQFDNAQFEKNVSQSISTLDKLKEALQLGKTGKGLTQFQNGINNLNVDGFTNAIQTGFGKINVATMALMSTVDYFTKRILSSLERTIKSLSVDQIINGWERYGEMTSAVQIIMAATRKELGVLFRDEQDQMEAVSEMMAQLNRFSDETSYSFTEMANSVGKFTSVGVSLKDAQIAIQGVATWGASAGRTVSEVNRAMYQLSQALGSGAMKLMDWKSIENLTMGTVEFKQAAMDAAVAAGTLKVSIKNGETVYTTATKRMKVTTDNFRDTLTTGWFNADVLTTVLKQYGGFADTLMSAIEQGFADGATDMHKYLDAWRENGPEALEAIAEDTGKSVDEIEEMLYRLTSFSGSDNSEEVIGKFAERYKMHIEDLSEWVNQYLADPNSFGKEQWNELSELTGQKASQLKKDFNSMKKSLKVNTMDTYAKKFGMSVVELGRAYKQYKDGTLDFIELSEKTGISVLNLQKDFAEMKKTDMELGEAAMWKAQEAKTLREALDATRDAVSTGWSKIFQSIFGNYLEAKELWTGVSEALWKAFAGQFENITDRLGDFFEGFRKYKGPEAFTNALWNLAEVVDHVNEIFANTLLDTFLPESGERLSYYARKFEAFTETLKNKIKDSAFIQIYSSALKVLFNTIKKLGSIAGKIIGSVAKAIGKLFGSKDAKNGSKLANILDNIADAIDRFEIPEFIQKGFDKALEMAAGAAGLLFKALGAVFYIIKNVGSAIGRILGPALKNIWDTITSLYDKVIAFFSADDFSFKKLFLSLFKSDEAKAKAEKFFDDIKEAFSGGIDDLAKWFKEKSEIIKNAILGLFGFGEEGKEGSRGKGEGDNSLPKLVEKTTEKIGFIQQIINAIKGLFKDLEKDGDPAENVNVDGIENSVKLTEKIYNLLAGFASDLTFGIIDKTVFEKVFDTIQTVIISGLDVIKAIAEAFSNMATNYISSKDLNDLAYLRSYILDAIKIFLSIKFAFAARDIAALPADVAFYLQKVTKKAIKAWKQVKIAEALPEIFRSLATLLATIAGVAIIFALIPAEKLDQGFKYLGILAAGLVAFIGAIVILIKILVGKGGAESPGQLAKDLLKTYSGLGTFIGALFGLSFLLFGIGSALSRIGKLSPDQLWRAVGVLGGFLVLFAVLFGIIYKMADANHVMQLVNATLVFEKIGKAISKIALSMMLVALSLAILGAIPVLLLVKALATIAILGVVFAAVAILNNITQKRNKDGSLVNNNNNIFNNMAKALLSMALSIILLSIFGPSDFGKALKVIAEIALAMMAMVAVFNIIASTETKMSPDQVKATNKTLGLLSGLLVTFAAVMILMEKFGPTFGKAMGYTLAFYLLLIGMAATMGLIVSLSEKNGPDAIKQAGKTMATMSACLIIISAAIFIMSKIPWNEAGNMSERIASMMGIFILMGTLMAAIIKFVPNLSPESLKAIGKSMLMLSGVLVIIAYVMSMLSKIPTDSVASMQTNMGVLGVLFAEMAGFLAILASTGADAKKFKSIGTTMLMMSGVFVILAMVMNMLVLIPMDSNMTIKLIWIGGFVALLGLLMTILGSLKDADAAKYSAIGKGFATMSLVLVVVAGVMGMLNRIKMKEGFDKKMALLLASVIIIGILMGVLSKIGEKSTLGMGAAVIAMIALAGSLVIVAATMKMLADVEWKTIAKAAVIIAIVVGAIALLAAISISPLGAGLLVLAVFLAELTVSLILISVAAIGFSLAVAIIVGAIGLLGVIWKEHSKEIMDAINQLIAILPVLGTAVGEFIGNMLAALAQGLVDTLNVFYDNREAIGNALYELGVIGFNALARAIAEASSAIALSVVQVILAICSTIVQYADLIVIMVQGVVIKVVNGIIELTYLYNQAGLALGMGIVGGLMKAIGEKLSGTALGELFGIGQDWVEKGQNLMDKAKIELPEGFEEAYQQAKDIADGLRSGTDEVSTAAEEVGKAGRESLFSALLGGESGADGTGSLFSNLFGGAEGGIGGIIGQFKGLLTPEGLGIDTSLFDISKWFNFEGVTTESGPLNEMKNSLVTNMETAGTEAGTAGGNALVMTTFNTIGNGGGASREEMESSLNNIIDPEIFDQIGVESGESYLGGLGSTFDTPSEDLLSGIDGLSSSIKGKVEEKKTDMSDAGRNLMTGLAEGIRKGESSPINAVQALARKIKAAVMRGLEEASPSKFTRRVGVYFDQGLALGIDDGASKVVSASDRMTQALTESFSSAVNSANDILNGGINDDLTIRPVVDMSDVTDKAQLLNSIFDKSVATSINLANSIGPKAAAVIANKNAASLNANNQSNSITLYVDGIKYNTDDYIDSSITGFVENMIRRGQMYGGA